MRLLSTIITTIALMCVSVTGVPDTDYQRTQELADKLFDDGKYKAAEKHYKTLGRVGDKYAQYRLSVIYHQGLNSRRNLPEAYAWAHVAAMNNHQGLVEHRDQVWASIPAAQHTESKKKAERFESLYSDISIARRLERASRQRLNSCTGSRVGSTCESVYAAAMPRAAGIAAGGAGDTGSSAARVGVGSESGASSGGEARNVEYYQDLRDTVREVGTYIDGRGQVELGEFKVIEDGEPQNETKEDPP